MDDEVSTCEPVSVSYTLDPQTTYLTVRIAAIENVTNEAVNEFNGHFADSARLHTEVIPEPGLALVGLSTICFPFFRKR